MSDRLNFYEILQVSPHATPDVIKAAHRALSKTMHPDAGGSNELAVAINEALDVLSDPSQRTRYDLELRIGKAKTFGAASAPGERVVEVLMVVCLGCGFKNRVRDTEAISRAKCGSCGALFDKNPSASSYGAPRRDAKPGPATPRGESTLTVSDRHASVVIVFTCVVLLFIFAILSLR